MPSLENWTCPCTCTFTLYYHIYNYCMWFLNVKSPSLSPSLHPSLSLSHSEVVEEGSGQGVPEAGGTE